MSDRQCIFFVYKPDRFKKAVTLPATAHLSVERNAGANVTE